MSPSLIRLEEGSVAMVVHAWHRSRGCSDKQTANLWRSSGIWVAQKKIEEGDGSEWGKAGRKAVRHQLGMAWS
jgi:hypothetical protein